MARIIKTITEKRVLEVAQSGTMFDGAGAAAMTDIIGAGLLAVPERHTEVGAEITLQVLAELMDELPVPTRVEEFDEAYRSRINSTLPERMKPKR